MAGHRLRLGFSIAAITIFALAAPTLAAKSEIYTGFLSSVAVGGHDPVAYFPEKQPVKGSDKFELKHKGVTWRFASRANREKFRADPAAFAPKYGGYCAWAVSQGSTAPIDPDAWAVHKGKLYLNYSKPVQWRWAFDKDGNIAKGDTNWPKIKAGG